MTAGEVKGVKSTDIPQRRDVLQLITLAEVKGMKGREIVKR
jgi:hypothetical protein